MYCPVCNNEIAQGNSFCSYCGTKVSTPADAPASAPAPAPAPAPATTDKGVNFDFSNNSATVVNNTKKMYQYKVLSQKDKWFSGKFDPTLLEQAINAYAQQGWRVISCATADIPGFGTTRQEFITVLEREI